MSKILCTLFGVLPITELMSHYISVFKEKTLLDALFLSRKNINLILQT